MAQAPSRAAGMNTWCEVDVEALAANVRTFRNRLARGSLLGIVVKSNAYGHGLAGASRAFVADMRALSPQPPAIRIYAAEDIVAKLMG